MKFKLAANKTKYILPPAPRNERVDEKGKWRQGRGKRELVMKQKNFDVKKEGYLGSYWDYFGYKSRSKVVGVAGIRDFVYVRTLKPLIERMWEYMFNCVCLFVTL